MRKLYDLSEEFFHGLTYEKISLKCLDFKEAVNEIFDCDSDLSIHRYNSNLMQVSLKDRMNKFSFHIVLETYGSYNIWYKTRWTRVGFDDMEIVYRGFRIDQDFDNIIIGSFGIYGTDLTHIIINSGKKYYHELDDHEMEMLKMEKMLL
jgi:hypothetical protein